jgi:hypothetical protein
VEFSNSYKLKPKHKMARGISVQIPEERPQIDFQQPLYEALNIKSSQQKL